MKIETHKLLKAERSMLIGINMQLERIKKEIQDLQGQKDVIFDEAFARLDIDLDQVGKTIQEPQVDLENGVILVTPIEKQPKEAK